MRIRSASLPLRSAKGSENALALAHHLEVGGPGKHGRAADPVVAQEGFVALQHGDEAGLRGVGRIVARQQARGRRRDGFLRRGPGHPIPFLGERIGRRPDPARAARTAVIRVQA